MRKITEGKENNSKCNLLWFSDSKNDLVFFPNKSMLPPFSKTTE